MLAARGQVWAAASTASFATARWGALRLDPLVALDHRGCDKRCGSWRDQLDQAVAFLTMFVTA
ncbi:hypothetical protein XH97_01045 [Bradyrhizobium sp. CCBAU 53380]|nr:hypothetical protein [Bradyrhizobium sp. CCBAU 53380]